MGFFSARRTRIIFYVLFLGLILVAGTHILSPKSVYAQTTPSPSPVSSNPVWEFDPDVTEVGKNAERGRELLWWVWTHPPIYHAPIIAQVWGVSLKLAYIFISFVVVAFGLGMILTRGKGTVGPIFSGISSPVAGFTWQSIFVKIGAVLLYVTFSYLLVLGLIQVGEIAMKLIRDIGGGDLFNVIFSGSGNIEDNYINFIGFSDTNLVNREMVNTSIYLIKTTTMTYNIMALLLILRAVILWFLLILSPFLAFLMPFIFIRNMGWIWIGVFFQWLFYGPLMTLFLVGITQIWVYGIPYPFDFTRADKASGQVYKTAINILYGGPAQVISPGNSANYIDTYAEYIISLVMLWAAIILPWWLLRIFRDYCCEAIASSNATLTAIFDRFRQFPPPPPSISPTPTTQAKIAVELPFRESIKEKVKEVEKTRIEEIRVKEISQVETAEIAKALKVAVSSLADVSKLETNQLRRGEVRQNLDKLYAPERIASSVERERFAKLKNELTARAAVGDSVAQAILAASENKKDVLATRVTRITGVRSEVSSPVKVHGVYAPTAPVSTPVVRPFAQQALQSNVVQSIARSVDESESIVRSLLQSISTTDISSVKLITTLAQQVGLSEAKVQEIIDTTTNAVVTQPSTLQNIAKQTELSVEKVKQVLQSTQTVGVASSQIIEKIAQKTDLSDTKVQDVLATMSGAIVTRPEAVQDIAKQVGISQDKVREVLQAIPLTNVSGPEALVVLAQKLGLSEAKVKEIINTAGGTTVKTPVPTVSVEDYEEVKSMWLKHYREAPVPVSEKIKTRSEWVAEEEKKLNNMSNLLASSDPKLRQKGLEQVAEILPFMLLGGFSEVEILTYVKAKLEADRQIQEELKLLEKAKEEEKRKLVEGEETLVEVAPQKTEEKKQAELAAEKKMELPEDEKTEEKAIGKAETPQEKKEKISQ